MEITKTKFTKTTTKILLGESDILEMLIKSGAIDLETAKIVSHCYFDESNNTVEFIFEHDHFDDGAR